MSIVIDVQNLGKLYRLGEVGTGTLSHDLSRWWAVVRGKDDPFSKVGNVNDRTKHAVKSEYVWALQDISFQIAQGDVVGIIGKNGAGKSTLLKILSRITAPSTGHVKLKGRIASLLEVGTGFHPEMTGRENIYMNGTVMGMRRFEIARKFDEIVEFAGVAKYIDTPVKRYSSGMMVRLGFAVAAFLEPEILIVDEVLAVGDAEFQRKAIGKMQDVSKGSGRTVLFVSHNMASIENLCRHTILMKNGRLMSYGDTNLIIESYLKNTFVASKKITDILERQGAGEVKFSDLKLLDEKKNELEALKSGKRIIIRLEYHLTDRNSSSINSSRISLAIKKDSQPLIVLSSELTYRRNIVLKDHGYVDFIINEFPLSEGYYDLTLFLEGNGQIQDWLTLDRYLSVVDGDFYHTGVNYPVGWQGRTVLIRHEIELH